MNQEIITLLSLGIVGTLFAWGVKHLKKLFWMKGTETKVAVAILALIVAGLYVWVRDTAYWGTFLMIIMVSQTVYGFFIKK